MYFSDYKERKPTFKNTFFISILFINATKKLLTSFRRQSFEKMALKQLVNHIAELQTWKFPQKVYSKELYTYTII